MPGALNLAKSYRRDSRSPHLCRATAWNALVEVSKLLSCCRRPVHVEGYASIPSPLRGVRSVGRRTRSLETFDGDDSQDAMFGERRPTGAAVADACTTH